MNLVNPFVIWQFIMKELLGKIYCIYVIVKNGESIHYSHVIGRGLRFPFMGKNDIEIGPCWTKPNFRNQGIFTSVIKRIIFDFGDNKAWMICDESNLASRRVIEKTGFTLVAKGERTRPLGINLIGRFIFSKVGDY